MKLKLDKQELKTHAKAYGKKSVGFAIKAAILYAILTVIGLIGGGIGAHWAADHYALATWLDWVSTIAGIALGGVIGFFAAQFIIMDMIQEMIQDAGIEAGKAGYKAAKAKLADRNGQEPEKPAENTDKLT
ncbi:MAG: hypothetical protein PSY14_07955 [bacterium]|nr:hypothetical protein [bacterium]